MSIGYWLDISKNDPNSLAKSSPSLKLTVLSILSALFPIKMTLLKLEKLLLFFN